MIYNRRVQKHCLVLFFCRVNLAWCIGKLICWLKPVTKTHSGRGPGQWAKSRIAFHKNTPRFPPSHLTAIYVLFGSLRSPMDLRRTTCKTRRASTDTDTHWQTWNTTSWQTREIPVKAAYDWCPNTEKGMKPIKTNEEWQLTTIEAEQT